MTFDINIPTEFICSLISVSGVVVSALISRSVSKSTAAKEIEQMQLTWEHEDLVSSEDEFGEMAAAVARYISNFHEANQRDALAKITSIRAQENGDLAEALDELYNAVHQRNCREINDYLTKVINTKRSLRCGAESSGQGKKKK